MEFFCGLGCGLSVTLFVCAILAKRDHEDWCRISERQAKEIERLRQRDEADWWKNN